MRKKRRSIGRRATVILISALCAFALAQVVLASIMAIWRPRPAYDPEFAHKLVELRQRLSERRGNGPLILVFGSSRTATAFRQDTLESAMKEDGDGRRIFNFGICRWWSPASEAVVFNRVLRDGIRPAEVWFEVLPVFMTADRRQIDKLDVARLSQDDLKAIEKYASSRSKLHFDWAVSRGFPAFFNRFLFVSEILPGWVEKDRKIAFNWATLGAWGWTRLPAYDQSYGLNVGLVPIYQRGLRQMYVSVINYEIYRDMLLKCRKEGIKAGFILLPEDHRIRECYTPLAEERLQTVFGVLKREFHMPVVDARAWMPDEAFVEGVHLTHSGAKTFTKLFDERVNARAETGGGSKVAKKATD